VPFVHISWPSSLKFQRYFTIGAQGAGHMAITSFELF
jgi:hypothetical protein